MRTLIACSVVILTMSGAGAAQELPVTPYTEFALRVQGGSVVKGEEGVPLARVRRFVTADLPGEIEVPDDAARAFSRFEGRMHKANRWGMATQGFGVVAVGATLYMVSSRWVSPSARGLDVALVVSAVTSGGVLVSSTLERLNLRRAEDFLSRGIWLYNAGLDR